jgi:hypothetical protein
VAKNIPTQYNIRTVVKNFLSLLMFIISISDKGCFYTTFGYHKPVIFFSGEAYV